MRARSVLTIVMALILAGQPLLVATPFASGDADGSTRSGENLTITDEYVVRDRQEWGDVIVKGTGTLRIVEGGTLIAQNVRMWEGSRLHITSGVLVIWGEDDHSDSVLDGLCDELVITKGGLLLMEGQPADVTYTMGTNIIIELEVATRVLIEDSQVLVTGGAGYSPETPITDGDLVGRHFQGGAAVIALTMEPTGSGISIVRSSIGAIGGHAGDAPDGRPSIGALGGAAGGYSAGGNILYDVGNGGFADIELVGPRIDIRSSLVEVTGGHGGDAGDGAAPGDGTGGGGGGGYTGGKGAGSDGPAGNGGHVTGRVGMGGEAWYYVETHSYTSSDSSVLVNGGDGGDAGNGGDCDPSRPDTILSGAGGGGYSGGGGGASGTLTGTDGGHGGTVRGQVGAGGLAYIWVEANESVLHSSELLATGGTGGQGGTAGTSTRGVGDWDWRAGGGGGSYSAGGGGGTSSSSWSSGTGGTGGPVLGHVAAGGNATLDLIMTNATITTNNTLYAFPGDGGACTRSDAPGVAGGEGRGNVTADGYVREHIPMARVELLSPDAGMVSSSIPTFVWGKAHYATAAGRVMRYEFQMDDDPKFGSPEMKVTIGSNVLEPGWLPNFTNYWRVRALYERPWLDPGPWSIPRAITYINLPPEIGPIPQVAILVSQVITVDLTPYITDPDNKMAHLSLDTHHPNVVSISKLNLTLHFPEELGTIPINFTVSDGLNEVMGQLIVTVARYRHPPFILGVTNHKPPLELSLFEGTNSMYDILVHDVDSTRFTYWVNSSWNGAVAYSNGTLRVRAATGEVGQHDFILYVADEGGREASIKVSVHVLNVNDPPDLPTILSPKKRITVREGELVSFSALVSDPDLRYGQVLNVTFVSNETGVMRTVQTTTTASVTSSALPVGEHVVTVVVHDGQFSSSDQVVVVVEAPPEPPPVKTSGTDGPPMWVYLVASIVLFAVGFTGGHVHQRRRSGNGPDVSP